MKRSLMILFATAVAAWSQVQYAFTNFAGLPGVPGSADGTGNTARLSFPKGVAVDSAGNVYVADSDNATIRKITTAGAVTTLAGRFGEKGSGDGSGSAARFFNPSGVAADKVGNVYVGDANNHTIRKITPIGEVMTLAGSAGQSGSVDGIAEVARFSIPFGVAVNSAGNVYVADSGNHTIRKITSSGEVTTLAGSAGQSGSDDGTGSAARFNSPLGVAVDGASNVYVGDTLNFTIRKITSAGVVTTLAGSAGQNGSADGKGNAARFNRPCGIAVDGAGNIYVPDQLNHTIRSVTPAGEVTTLAGSAGKSGSDDGIGSIARFFFPLFLAVDSSSTIYVADTQNQRIAKGTPLYFQFGASAGSLTVSNGLFHTRLTGPSGSNVVVEASSDFQTWTPVQTNVLSPTGLAVSVSLGTNQQFLRARLAP